MEVSLWLGGFNGRLGFYCATAWRHLAGHLLCKGGILALLTKSAR
jgi:hypothetical protein